MLIIWATITLASGSATEKKTIGWKKSLSTGAITLLRVPGRGDIHRDNALFQAELFSHQWSKSARLSISTNSDLFTIPFT